MQLEFLQKEMIAAMKAKDKLKKDAVSSLIAAVKRVAIDEGVRDNIPEELVDRVILKEVKSLKEQVDTCPADRQDLLEEYKAKLAAVEAYAPKLMSEEEIVAFLKANCAELIEQKNKGMIMRTAMGQLKGKADGKLINQIVADLCK
ncbi:MAG: GatB/YqeY domain-containing protein [Clostridia bacterium]|nr:GatB/YqeY domain-containing protein [Clostridia bacterium]